MPKIIVDTSFGRLVVEEQNGFIVRLTWNDAEDNGAAASPLLHEAAAQIRAYDAGQLRRFDLPLRIEGSEFQKQVCDAMSAIPFGDTRTYGDIARDLDHPAQAVGQACGANPIPVIIPCHRVLAASGLGGFSGAGGIETKVALLRHEGAAGLLI
ncbi:methylated-DNA--[protein]-cysteine S-methyltransferase [Ruegeria sediminis]|uniref:methylated-DNA--[protein]-cysteine S-methyltransferase n=1 Tax=Ruegeria sediminis TaxID=2583820 RepID=UPI001FE7E8F9|nr:methylated-DNA--[protein]-cysteine S-methyltransferase [Ruegeria sediminis]